MANIKDFVEEHKGKIFRYWVYKKFFTPYETDKKFSDESCFECDDAEYAYIENAYEIPGDILLELRDAEWQIECEIKGQKENNHTCYYRLSEVSLEYWDSDKKKLRDEWELEDSEEEV